MIYFLFFLGQEILRNDAFPYSDCKVIMKFEYSVISVMLYIDLEDRRVASAGQLFVFGLGRQKFSCIKFVFPFFRVMCLGVAAIVYWY